MKTGSTRQVWTPEELDYLCQHYANTATKELAQHLRRPLSKVYAKATKLGLEKSAEYLLSPAACRLRRGDEVGKSFLFTKGQVPANKGLRRPSYAPGRMKETQFKKGQRSGIAARNWRPIGTILPDPDGYLRIKVREAVHGRETTGFGNTRVWPLFHRYVWEQTKGPIPVGHLITFKDRDRSNCAVDNLACISKAENARRNNMWANYPRELAEAIQLQCVLRRRLSRRERASGKKQDSGSSQPSL